MNSIVSILMPMRNAEAYIQETIESLLKQSFFDFELIIVNDGSEDNSQVLVESFTDERIILIEGECKGISAALNLALNYASGMYVCRCDADDLYPPERLKVQTEWLKSHSEYIAVAGEFSSMDELGHIISKFNTGDEECDLTPELLNAITRTHLCTFLIKNSVVKQLQGFREYFVTAEDIDMQLRLAECGMVGYIPQNMYFYRLHNDSITHVQSSSKRIFYEKLARKFLLQRLESGVDLLGKGMPPRPPVIDDKPSDSIEQVVGYMVSEAWRLHAKKQRKPALLMAFRACKKMPMDWRVWKNIFMVLVKR